MQLASTSRPKYSRKNLQRSYARLRQKNHRIESKAQKGKKLSFLSLKEFFLWQGFPKHSQGGGFEREEKKSRMQLSDFLSRGTSLQSSLCPFSSLKNVKGCFLVQLTFLSFLGVGGVREWKREDRKRIWLYFRWSMKPISAKFCSWLICDI